MSIVTYNSHILGLVNYIQAIINNHIKTRVDKMVFDNLVIDSYKPIDLFYVKVIFTMSDPG